MKCPIIPMSFAEYEVLERPFGWKVEYWDGHARLSPRGIGVTTRIELGARDSVGRLSRSHRLIPVEPSYTEAMISGYFETFADSVEFCGWPLEDIQESAQRGITRYFAGKKGEPLAASVIALEPDSQQLAALALFVLRYAKQGYTQQADQHQDDASENPLNLAPHLELLYVRPPFQRQGMATAMVTWAMERLRETGFQGLFSTYHICNQGSRQWHHGFGFEDVYDLYYIRLRQTWLNQEIWRRETVGQLADVEALIQEREHWATLLHEGDPSELGEGLTGVTANTASPERASDKQL